MSKEIKLNLGCGDNYKPGYINIDKYNESIADKICDIENLPFKSNSIDLIEADQLIEHFDYVQSKYVLSEWFRILKPEGALILETPDLEMTYKKFISENIDSQKMTLQWIFGINSSGFHHKTGFTLNLLRDLLEEIGFEKISSEEQQTYTYEYGLRIVCKKPQNYSENQLFACFRKNLKNKLQINDSILLIPLENWLKILLETYNIHNDNTIVCLDKIISKTAICNPLIPLTFSEELIKFGMINEHEIELKMKFLNKLVEQQFQQKLFTLWIKNKKELGEVKSEFEKFVKHIEKLILDALNYPQDFIERYKYIFLLSLKDVILFDFDLIILEANRLFNLGVKLFHNKSHYDAGDYFRKSSKINPDNYLIYWNFARLGCIINLNENLIIYNYENALKLVRDVKNQEKIEAEMKLIRNGERDLIPKEPIPENY